MSLLPAENMQISRSATGALFDWHDAAELRHVALAAGLDVARYLLAPEVGQLLDYLPDQRQRLLIETLWNTGARINEALALTPADFMLDTGRAFVVLKTLKQRQRGKGRPRKDEALKRAVPLSDVAYVQRLREYMATIKPKRHEPLWPLTDDTARNWLNRALARAKSDGVTFSVNPVTPKTFRHSYAMHLIQHRVPLKVIQAFMGHQALSSTEVYTKVFTLDVGREYAIQFTI